MGIAMSHIGRLTVLRPLAFMFAAVLLPPLLGVAPAAAEPRHTRERDARKACLKGDYTKGVDILVDLFV
jgi:hypothetical protein